MNEYAEWYCPQCKHGWALDEFRRLERDIPEYDDRIAGHCYCGYGFPEVSKQ